MEQQIDKPYKFIKSFLNNFSRNTGIVCTQPVIESIKEALILYKPYRKIDNKGRDTEYFTCRINGILVTIVCNAITHAVLTGVIETHNRPQFRDR